MVFIEIVVGLCTIYLLMMIRAFITRNKKEPPGPFPYPLIGNLLQVALLDSKYPYIALNKMSEKYGEIFTLQMGIVKSVCIQGYRGIKKVLQDDAYNGRVDYHWIIDKSYGERIGIIFSDVEHWRECRRVTTRLLREFGFGKKKSMEELVIEELEEFCNYMMTLADENNGRVTIAHIFNSFVLNNVWTMFSGQRIGAQDEQTMNLVRLVYDWTKHASYANNSLIGAYPFLSKLAPKLVSFDKIHNNNVQTQKYLEGLIAEHRSRDTYKPEPENFIQAYLKLIDEAEQNETVGNIYTEKTLVAILSDFFLAASDTTSGTINYAILFLIIYPEVQKKIRAELDSVVGEHRWPTYEDKEKMPYTEATMLEIFRMSNVAPIGPRKLEQDATFDDYVLSKGTVVLLNFYSASFDENAWDEPFKFKPERFLDSEGTKVINADKLLTFSAGKRNCLGELLAKMTIWTFLTGLVQKIYFENVPGAILPDPLLPVTGLSNAPPKFDVLVKRRE